MPHLGEEAVRPALHLVQRLGRHHHQRHAGRQVVLMDARQHDTTPHHPWREVSRIAPTHLPTCPVPPSSLAHLVVEVEERLPHVPALRLGQVEQRATVARAELHATTTTPAASTVQPAPSGLTERLVHETNQGHPLINQS